MDAIRKILFLALLVAGPATAAPSVTGVITDAETGKPVAARLYIESKERNFHHAASPLGTAIPYRVQRGASIEVHTTLSAHPFAADLPAGTYTLTAERGKEYHPASKTITVKAGAESPVTVNLKLRRWTSETLASRGWFSGDTHVHRTVKDLPTLLLAEDLNVGLPLTSWVTDSREAPNVANKNPDPVPPAKLIKVDNTHVIWPVNTEYEIFTVNGKRHTLGAVFALNHRKPFELTAPPVRPIAEEARRQGAILDLDKHNWPWSMMLVPVMGVELFELTNNHVWRTEFFFNRWQESYTPAHFHVERDENGYTEKGWIRYGLQNYYALLNCGFRMMPSAGTASGVHPVPLGFGRVYVKIDGEFSYEKWMKGLAEGKSFVTTGPILTAKVKRLDREWGEVEGVYEGRYHPGDIEIVVNGRVRGVVHRSKVERNERGAFLVPFKTKYPIEKSSWVAVRCFERRADGRPRFAHTAPVYLMTEGEPLTQRKGDVEFLVKRVEEELRRHTGVLPEEALEEYRDAAAAFRKHLPKPQ